jgi:site-specific recombinase XerD
MAQELVEYNSWIDPISELSREKDAIASREAFSKYHEKIDKNTLKRQRHDLALFCQYIKAHGVFINVEDLMNNPISWNGITYGLIDDFVGWMTDEGFAIGSINVRLSTVKVYIKLAVKAGCVEEQELAKVLLVKGYRYKEGRQVDDKREVKRKGDKKAKPIALTKEQIDLLKMQHPDTPQGRRDALLMCLLLNHGLRCGETADLTIDNIDLSSRVMTFEREKIEGEQKHRLNPETYLALIRYLEVYQPTGALLAGSTRHGKLEGAMSRRAITKRVQILGKLILGIENLSAHDCRHACVDSMIRGGTDIKTIQETGGWTNLAMPMRYAAKAKIANEGVKLG